MDEFSKLLRDMDADSAPIGDLGGNVPTNSRTKKAYVYVYKEPTNKEIKEYRIEFHDNKKYKRRIGGNLLELIGLLEAEQ
jgi:hypothetical protein